MGPSLQGRVCLVTGACRGIGKGIALQLGAAGATVYITGSGTCSSPGGGGINHLGNSGLTCPFLILNLVSGRTQKNLDECAAEIKSRGGNPVPVQMDHGQDSGQCRLCQNSVPEPTLNLHHLKVFRDRTLIQRDPLTQQ